jgi:major membrane immunogen (membrane-anchored lipoprotein)
MKKAKIKKCNEALIFVSLVFLIACSSSGNKNSNKMKNSVNNGTYGSDVAFFTEKGIKTVELKDAESKASV